MVCVVVGVVARSECWIRGASHVESVVASFVVVCMVMELFWFVVLGGSAELDVDDGRVGYIHVHVCVVSNSGLGTISHVLVRKYTK